MTTQYKHTATGTLHRPGDVVAGVQTHARMPASTWALLGCVPYAPPTPPPPEPPTLAELQAAALARFRAEAKSVLARNAPEPWDQAGESATPEYRAWLTTFRDALFAELARIETAIADTEDPAELAAITADWPEVA